MKLALIFLFVMATTEAWPQARSVPNTPGQWVSSDERAELIPSEVLETHENYEVRRYPSSKWVCSSAEVDVSEDEFADWSSNFNNVFEAMNTAKFDERADSKLFMRLFKYIIGLNEQGIEIDMTRPVTTRRTLVNVGDDNKLQLHEMCFWTGSPWADQPLPKPLEKEVYFQRRPELDFYVRRFGGYVLSNEEWSSHYEKLLKELESEDRSDFEQNAFFSVAYNSPMTTEDRQNEVWILRPKESTLNRNNNEDDEDLPYEIIAQADGYELRSYPGTKWVCTSAKDHDATNDPMNNWREEFEDDAFRAMNARKRLKSSPNRAMFKKLYQYIVGVNADAVEIEMTSPVTTLHRITSENEPVIEDLEMCFWTGVPWMHKTLPEPLKEGVYVQQRQPIVVYARRFGGWALSSRDWEQERQKLIDDLNRDGIEVENDIFFSAGYNSPWKVDDRRNEIWIPAPEYEIANIDNNEEEKNNEEDNEENNEEEENENNEEEENENNEEEENNENNEEGNE